MLRTEFCLYDIVYTADGDIGYISSSVSAYLTDDYKNQDYQVYSFKYDNICTYHYHELHHIPIEDAVNYLLQGHCCWEGTDDDGIDIQEFSSSIDEIPDSPYEVEFYSYYVGNIEIRKNNPDDKTYQVLWNDVDIDFEVITMADICRFHMFAYGTINPILQYFIDLSCNPSMDKIQAIIKAITDAETT